MRHFETTADEELIVISRGGDSAATDFLMEKYKGLVRSKASKLYLPDGGDREDLIQEGMLGLFKALRDYDAQKGTSFATFAGLCITRQLYAAIEAAGRKKHQPLNEAVSYDAVLMSRKEADGGERPDAYRTGESCLTMLASEEEDPENRYILEESGRELEKDIHEVLSPMEREVLELYLADWDYIAIAEKLGKDPKSTDNALQRIKAKVRRLLKF